MSSNSQDSSSSRPKFFTIDDPKALRQTWKHVKDPEEFTQTLLSRPIAAGQDVSHTALRRALAHFFNSDGVANSKNGSNSNLSFEIWLSRQVDSAARLLAVARLQPPHILFPSNPAQFQGTRSFCHSILANAVLGNLAHDPVGSLKQQTAQELQTYRRQSSTLGNGLLDWTTALFPSSNEIAFNSVLCLLQYFVTTASMHAEEDDEDDEDDDDDDLNRLFWEEIVTFQRISNFTRSEFENLLAWDHIRVQSSPWQNHDEILDASAMSEQELKRQPPHTPNVLHSITTRPMEDARCSAMVNFANEVFGVGEFSGTTATQEEIIQFTCPEFNVGMMCFGYLPEEGVVIARNVRRFSQYSGYWKTFTFQGPLPNRFAQTIIAMDAINLNGIELDDEILDEEDSTMTQHRVHFLPDLVLRDLQKAYMGFLGSAVADFSSRRNRDNDSVAAEAIAPYIISTGKWGCGAFGGNVFLKFLQQVVAAYLCCGPSPPLTTPRLTRQGSIDHGQQERVQPRDSPYVCLRFSAYRDKELQAELEQVYEACHGLTPRQILNEVLIEGRHASTLFDEEDGVVKFRVDRMVNLLHNIQRLS